MSMDIRTLTKLILKLTGAYLLAMMLISIPPVAVTPREFLAPAILSLIVYALVGATLLWFPGAIINRVIRIEGAELEGAPTAEKLLHIGVRLLGCYFALSALYTLVFTLAKVRLFFAGTHGPKFMPDDSAALLASGVQVAIGLLLWFAGGFFVRITRGIHNER